MSKRAKTPRGRGTAAAGEKRQKVRDVYVGRPFEGLADEPEWIALRELVPAASAPLKLAPPVIERYGDRSVILATVLPMAWPAMTKPDGRVFIGLQRHVQSGDVSRDLSVALLCALETPPGQTVGVPALPGVGPRLQDVLENAPLDITVHTGFEFWGQDMPDPDGELAASLERASEAVVPTARLTSVEAAYWCRIGSRTHLRWVLPDAEAPLLDALARLHAVRELGLGDGTKYVGAFRALGLVVPVWDLAPDTEAADVEEPAVALRKRLDEALARTEPLSPQERRSRAGLLSRQVTLR